MTNSRRTSCGPTPGRGPAVEKQCSSVTLRYAVTFMSKHGMAWHGMAWKNSGSVVVYKG